MTAPSPDEQPADRPGGKPKASAADPVKVLGVVEFPHPDSLLGGEHRSLGVVFEVRDGTAKVVPLAHHSVQVDLADVLPLNADDLSS